MRISDWSSDVCSSDLRAALTAAHFWKSRMPDQPKVSKNALPHHSVPRLGSARVVNGGAPDQNQKRGGLTAGLVRSEERREGNEGDSTGRYRWSAVTQQEKKHNSRVSENVHRIY